MAREDQICPRTIARHHCESLKTPSSTISAATIHDYNLLLMGGVNDTAMCAWFCVHLTEDGHIYAVWTDICRAAGRQDRYRVDAQTGA